MICLFIIVICNINNSKFVRMYRLRYGNLQEEETNTFLKIVFWFLLLQVNIEILYRIKDKIIKMINLVLIKQLPLVAFPLD